MRLVKTATPIGDVMNPRGRLAKDLEKAARQAHWLSVVCEHWLTFHNDNVDAAAHDKPYTLPPSYPYAKRLNKALRECGMYDSRPAAVPSMRMRELKSGEIKFKRGGKDINDPESIPVHEPSWDSRWDWTWVFNHWLSGGLAKSVETVVEILPDDNAEAIRLEMVK